MPEIHSMLSQAESTKRNSNLNNNPTGIIPLCKLQFVCTLIYNGQICTMPPAVLASVDRELKELLADINMETSSSVGYTIQ